jgi:2-polyprenyl-3-methyl-5-hydroxy-6-metoxy-1,4-benzoquinol methylase
MDEQKINELIEYAKNYDNLVIKSKTFARICESYDLKSKSVLDIGCGVGSHMQRFGQGSIGLTTNPLEVEVGKRIDRDIRLGNVEKLAEVFPDQQKFDVIWCNNIFEHLLSPHKFLVELKQYAHDETIIILGTPMVPFPAGLMRMRQFRGALASPHINFFTKKTYQLTAEFAGWTTLTLSPFKFGNRFIDKLASHQAPHLYLVAKNNTKYRYHEKKLKEWRGDSLYEPLIEIMNG